jgi:hypothetical protein
VRKIFPGKRRLILTPLPGWERGRERVAVEILDDDRDAALSPPMQIDISWSRFCPRERRIHENFAA